MFSFILQLSVCLRAYYLLHDVEDVVIDVALRVNSKGVVRGLVVVFEEEVLEGHRVLLFEGHHHLVTEAKQHQLQQRREDRGKKEERGKSEIRHEEE